MLGEPWMYRDGKVCGTQYSSCRLLLNSLTNHFSNSIDLHDGVLTVSYPTLIHASIDYLMDGLARNRSYPRELYQGSKIFLGGRADVFLGGGGIKSPDYSLYESRDDDRDGRSVLFPTVAWEIGYLEDENKLSFDAARLLCLSRGNVRLVIIVNIKHKQGSQPRELESVTWAHWEVDYDSIDLVSGEWWNGKLRDPQPHRDTGDEAMGGEHVPSAPTAYRTVLSMKGDNYQINAVRTRLYQVWCHSSPVYLRNDKLLQIYPESDDNDIEILYRHLYREPAEDDSIKPAVTIRCSDVWRVVKAYEELEQQREAAEQMTPEEIEADEEEAMEQLMKKKQQMQSHIT